MLLYSDLKNTLYDIFETYEFNNRDIRAVSGDANDKIIMIRNRGNLNRPDMIMIVDLSGKFVEKIEARVYKSFKGYKKFMNLLEEMLPSACDVMEVHYEW